jgi:bifunctional ADP-heptose synthase (sugar kinase/adenylyltransferase)
MVQPMSFPSFPIPSAPRAFGLVGDLMIDRYLVGQLRPVSPEAPVQVVNISKETHYARWRRETSLPISPALGAQATLDRRVGVDLAGTPLPKLLETHGVPSGRPRRRPRKADDGSRRASSAHRQQIVRFDVETASAVSRAVEDENSRAVSGARDPIDVVVLSIRQGGADDARGADACVVAGMASPCTSIRRVPIIQVRARRWSRPNARKPAPRLRSMTTAEA